MDSSVFETSIEENHPLDLVEQVITEQSWPFERSTIDELNIAVTGTWADYHMSINWRPELEALQVACAFDMKVPPHKRKSIYELICLVNEQMWLGHFDLWTDDGLLLFRHAHLLRGAATANEEQCESLVHAAVDACERHYPAFQFVVWGGKSAKEALSAALLECVGEA